MSPPTPSSNNSSITELRSLIARDLEASNELAACIAQLRQDIEDGKPQRAKKVDLMEQSNKDMTRDLVNCVESVESTGVLDADDRELLQALNARLAVCDLQASRLAELRDLEFAARGTKEKAFLDPGEGPSARVSKKKEAEEELEPGRTSTREENEDRSFVFVARDHDAASSFAGSDIGDERAPSEYSDEPQIDKSSWPLLYRIMDIDPDTLSWDMEPLVKASYKKLALKHSPQNFPNDPDAPAMWEKITKAYNVLADPEKRSFYDMHENTPEGLEGFDFSLIEDK